MPHVTEEIWSHLPHRTERLIVSAWPETDGSYADREPVFEQIRTAAEVFRRSGVMPDLTEDQHRIFEAVVRPERVKTDGDATSEIERLEKEVARAEKMLANERFVENAPPEVVEAEREKLDRYRRELDA